MTSELYNFRLIARLVADMGGYRAAGRATGLNDITIKRLALGEDVQVSTLRKFELGANVTVCELIAPECRRRRAGK